jgi:FAD/FMN-containing dehydrogenase
MSTSVDTKRRGFSGDIIEPGDAEYERASRSVLVAGTPTYVLRPASIGDVQAGVRFAADTGLPLSVRGGGHGFSGFGTNDDGIVIDLSRLSDVEVVDEERHLVRIGGGATWGQVMDALAPLGLAISSGDTRSVGVGGLTLSGGIGWKVRKYGLALDQLVAAEVVTAGGDVLRASADEHAELFWAIRGGGGNVGIVTVLEFAAHATTDVFHGRIVFPASEAAAVLQGWAEYVRRAPEELTLLASVQRDPTCPVELVEEPVHHDHEDYHRQKPGGCLHMECGDALGERVDDPDRDPPGDERGDEAEHGSRGYRSLIGLAGARPAGRDRREHQDALEPFAEDQHPYVEHRGGAGSAERIGAPASSYRRPYQSCNRYERRTPESDPAGRVPLLDRERL